MDTMTKEFWDKEIVRGNLIWPDEHVIRFVKGNYKAGADIRILDFGCGAGRNAIALAQEGYRVIAMDYNKSGLELLKKRAANFSEKIEYRVNDGLEVPLEDASVDGIVADGSLFYYGKTDTIELLKNLKKCLKKEGMIWADWRTKKDSLYGQGTELEDGLFRLNKDTGRDTCCYFFVDRDEICELYEAAGYQIQAVDEYTYTRNNGNKRFDYYHIVAKKA